MRMRQRVMPRPFLKWAGGKGQLLDELIARVMKAGDYARYHEPFIGGGALFFELARLGLINRKACFLSDTNPALIDAYEGVRSHVDAVIERLREHAARHGETHYYEVRRIVPENLVDRAARIIYLNKTCFNGLYRENSKGGFNTPMGRYKSPLICDEENLRAASAVLGEVRVECRSFEAVLDHAEPGDFVYFDPPYDPVGKTAKFTAYHKGGFSQDDQRRLAEVFRTLAQRGTKALLSNSMTDLVRELYAGFAIDEVYATRSVNSKGGSRGKVPEALVRSF